MTEGEIRGRVRKDRRTKWLTRRLRPHEIALLAHANLDRVAAQALVAARVKAVLNTAPALTPAYPAGGAQVLQEAGIPLIDLLPENLFDLLPEGQLVTIRGAQLWVEGRCLAEGRLLTPSLTAALIAEGQAHYHERFIQFLRNTVEHAGAETELLAAIDVPKLRTPLAGRHVLVVVRGPDYMADLRTLGPYLRERRPVLIAVDGGADALLEFGLRPHVIVGDMDSLSDRALRCRAELVVHAYPNGEAPGLARVRAMGLEATVFAAPGTSEDIALQLAYHHGASLVVTVGTHTGVIDFLEKGREGMASTLLTRMKIAHVLVDARGVSQLYRPRGNLPYVLLVCLAALVPAVLTLQRSPLAQAIAQLMWLKLRLGLGW